MKRSSLLSAALGLFTAGLILSGCSTPMETGSIPVSDKAAYAGAKTFSLFPDTDGRANDLTNRSYWAGVIKEQIASELVRKGYSAADQGGLSVAYHTITQSSDFVTLSDNYRGYSVVKPSGGPATHLDPFLGDIPESERIGTLVIDVVDPKAKKLLWRGWAKSELKPDMTADALRTVIGEAVPKILATFPDA